MRILTDDVSHPMMLLALLTLAQAEVTAGGAAAKPSITVGTELSPNTYRTWNNPVWSQAFVVTPAIDGSWHTPELDFDLHAHLTRHQVVWSRGEGDPSENAYQLSRTGFGGKAGLVVLPDRLVGLALSEDASVQQRLAPSGLSGGWKNMVTTTWSETTAAVRVSPGSALHVDLGGAGGFEQHALGTGPTFSDPTRTTRLAAGPRLDARWSFFPRTDLWVGGSVDWYTWSGGQVDAGLQWAAWAGVMGRIRPSLVINGVVGYTQIRSATYGVSSPLDGLTVNAKATWQPRRGTSLSAGYDKGLEDSWFTGALHWHYVFARWEQMLGSRLGVGLEGGTRFELYKGAISYPDQVTSTEASITYHLADRVDVQVSGGFWNRTTAGWDAPVRGEVTFAW